MIKYIVLLLATYSCVRSFPLEITKICSKVEANRNFLYVVDIVNRGNGMNDLHIACQLEKCVYIVCSQQPEYKIRPRKGLYKLKWSKKLTTNGRMRLLFVMGGVRKKESPIIRVSVMQGGKIVQCTTKNAVMKRDVWKKYLVQLSGDTLRLFNSYLAWYSLLMEENSPKLASIGDELSFSVRLHYDGSKIDNVVLDYTINPKFEYLEASQKPNKVKKNRLVWKWRTLENSVSITIKLKVKEKGLLYNSANLNCLQCSAQKIVSITKVNQSKKYFLRIKGSRTVYAGKRCRMKVFIHNTKDTALRNLRVVISLTNHFSIISRSDSPTISDSKIEWKISYLAAHDQRKFEFTLVFKLDGPSFALGKLMKGGLLLKEDAMLINCLASSALLLEVIEDVEPISVGEETQYLIRVTNCFSTDFKLIITAELPDGLIPIEVKGSTQGYIVKNKYIYFEAHPRLNVAQKIQFVIKVRATKTGDMRLRVSLFSKDLNDYVIEEENTYVY
ncbi:hypothetical protein [Candidatus Uabimicrobium sp. HlEnr_7]|uniref:hypothetical protein n=1 Tax=Candidatus Uabimicrobium helgolandensis TaxID=3095367 RepID=UPI0035570850